MARAKKYPGHIEERGNGFRVILRSEGKRHAYTLADVSREEAEDFARATYEKLSEEAKRRRLGLPDRLRVSELVRKFRDERFPLLSEGTRGAYAVTLDAFTTFLEARRADPEVQDVRQGHISDFLAWRRVHPGRGTEPLSNRTIQRDRSVLHTLFAFAEELELRDGNPVAKVKTPKADPRDPVILDAEEYDRLLEECQHNSMLYLYVLTMGETGARSKSEVLQLQWPDVDLEEEFIRIRSGGTRRRTKGGKGRWVPMTPRLAKVMREHFAAFRFARTADGKPVPWIFHHVRARRGVAKGDRIQNLRTGFARAAERAKLNPELHPHDLRHRRVTTWLAEGRNAVHVKEAVGHSDLRTTMSYTHLAREHLKSLVEEDGLRKGKGRGESAGGKGS